MTNTKATPCANRYLLIAGCWNPSQNHAIHLSVYNQSNPFFLGGDNLETPQRPKVAVSHCANGSNAVPPTTISCRIHHSVM